MQASKSRRNIHSFLLLLFPNLSAARSPYDAPIGDVHVRRMCRRSCRKGISAQGQHAYCTCPEKSASGDLYDNMLHVTLPKFACMEIQDRGLATSVTERPLGQCAVSPILTGFLNSRATDITNHRQITRGLSQHAGYCGSHFQQTLSVSHGEKSCNSG
jgi:hypothetical protein